MGEEVHRKHSDSKSVKSGVHAEIKHQDSFPDFLSISRYYHLIFHKQLEMYK